MQAESTKRIVQALSEQTRAILFGNDSVEDGLENIRSSIDSGFSFVQISLERMTDVLEEVMVAQISPAFTSAMEYYRVAVSMFQGGIHPEAINAIDKAIDVFPTEGRFHCLRGEILLGTSPGSEAQIDLVAAEQAFLRAARYLQLVDSKSAGYALSRAAWAAFADRRIEWARQYASDALERMPGNGRATYQAAKFAMADQDMVAGIALLEQAFARQSKYVALAVVDGDMQPYQDQINACAERLRHREQESVREKIAPSVMLAQKHESCCREELVKLDTIIQEWRYILNNQVELKRIRRCARACETEKTRLSSAIEEGSARAQRERRAYEALMQESRWRHEKEERAEAEERCRNGTCPQCSPLTRWWRRLTH